MGDPGLHSKFIEMQQEQAFAPPRERGGVINPYVEGLRLDRARIVGLLERATHKHHVAILKRSLKAIDEKLKF